MSGPISGTWFVCPTPFDDDGAVDVDSIGTLTEAAIDWGVDGLTVLGVMGEATSLTDAERDTVQEAFVSAAAGRVPVAVGCSSPSATVTAARIASAAKAGAAAVMVSAPTLAKDTDQIGPFFGAAARDADVPVIVQDEPAATGVPLPVSALLAALDACGSTVVKLEDPPTPPKISRLLAARSGLTVFGGLGGVSAYWELRRGGAGTMTGFRLPRDPAGAAAAVRGRRPVRRGCRLRPLSALHRLRGPTGRRARDPQGGAAPPWRHRRRAHPERASARRGRAWPSSTRCSGGSGSTRGRAPLAVDA